MNSEEMVETIKAGLKEADTNTLGLLLDVLRKSKQRVTMPPGVAEGIILRSSNKQTAPDRMLEFIGENLPFEAIEKLSIKERGAMQLRLKEQNREWLREKFTNLQALWLMVIDGQVQAWGKTMKDYPQPKQIMEICRKTGKYPFIFIDDDRMAIEESASVWHGLDADDFYQNQPKPNCPPRS